MLRRYVAASHRWGREDDEHRTLGLLLTIRKLCFATSGRRPCMCRPLFASPTVLPCGRPDRSLAKTPRANRNTRLARPVINKQGTYLDGPFIANAICERGV